MKPKLPNLRGQARSGQGLLMAHLTLNSHSVTLHCSQDMKTGSAICSVPLLTLTVLSPPALIWLPPSPLTTGSSFVSSQKLFQLFEELSLISVHATLWKLLSHFPWHTRQQCFSVYLSVTINYEHPETGHA